MKHKQKKSLGIILAGILLSSMSLSVLHMPETDCIQENHVLAADTQETDSILNQVLCQMAETVTEPVFGTTFGEWSVLCLARGGYIEQNSDYFQQYYERIVQTVNTEAAATGKNGALHAKKSTENSRLILALSAIGRNAENVGDWNLITPYDDFDWIKKQGINGPIFTLIALDTWNYQTTDETVRQQCLDYILERQFDDGGWALMGNTADPDITAMSLQALSRYRDNEQIAEAVERGITCLSQLQMDNGGYQSWGTINSESIAQVITACTALGIDPNTDERFIKNGSSAVDAILAFYNPDSLTFSHVLGDGGNAMATDQATYALVAYQRFIHGQNALYDMTDVAELIPDQQETVPENEEKNSIENPPVPDNIQPADTIPENGQQTEESGSETTSSESTTYHQETTSTAKTETKITRQETAETIFSASETARTETQTSTSARTAEDKPVFHAVCLYQGDDVDNIPSSRKAVAVSVTNISAGAELNYHDGKYTAAFLYNQEASDRTGASVYIALADAELDMHDLVNPEHYHINDEISADTLIFGDVNQDGVINAQDTLDVLNIWLKRNTITEDKQILSMNVNGDSKITNLDSAAISAAFVSGEEWGIMEKISALSGGNHE